MTNEEAKEFLDNLKICLEEHPVVADWLVEIADRKTDNSSEKPNNSKKRRECPWCKAVCASTDKYCHECGWHIADTPQTDRMTEEEIDTMLAKVLVGQTDCGWK